MASPAKAFVNPTYVSRWLFNPVVSGHSPSLAKTTMICYSMALIPKANLLLLVASRRIATDILVTSVSPNLPTTGQQHPLKG